MNNHIEQHRAILTVEIMISIILTVLLFLRGGEGVYQLALLEISAVAVLSVWISRQLRQQELILKPFPGMWALLIFILCLILSTFFSRYIYGSFAGFMEWASYLIIFLVMTQIRRSAVESVIIKIGAVLIGLQALLSFYQVWLLKEARASGSFTIANYFADFIIIGLCVGLAYLLFQKQKAAQKFLIGLIIVIFFAALYFSGSRGGLIIFLVIAFSLITLRNWRLGVLTAIIGAVLLFTVPNKLIDRFQEADIYSFTRLKIWNQAFEIIQLNPITGGGLNNYEYYAIQTNFPVTDAVGHYAKVARIAHNLYLQLAADTGLPALVLFLIFILAGYRRLYQRRATLSTMDIGLISSTLAIFLHGLVDNTLYTPVNALVFFVTWAYLMPPDADWKRFRFSINSPNGWIVYPLALSLILIAITLFRPIAEYHRFAAEKLEDRLEYDRGLVLLKRAEVLSPLNAHIPRALGRCYGKKFVRDNNPEWLLLSELAFSRSLKLNPLHYVTALDLAETRKGIYQQTGSINDFKRVIEAYEHALVWNPSNPFCWDEVGYFYAENYHFKEALDCFLTAIELEPNFVKGYQHAALAYQALQQPQRQQEFEDKAQAILDQKLAERSTTAYEKRLITP